MSWFKRLAYLRKWHPRRYLAGTKETRRSVRSIPFLPLKVFFCWLSAFCCLCLCFGFSLLHTANLASRRKRLRNAEHRAPITLWDRSTEKSPPAWNQSHDSLSIRGGLVAAGSCVLKSKQLVSLLFHLGHPINFLFQNTKLQTTLVGKGKRHLPKAFDCPHLWIPGAPRAEVLLCALEGGRSHGKPQPWTKADSQGLKACFTSLSGVIWDTLVYFSLLLLRCLIAGITLDDVCQEFCSALHTGKSSVYGY